MEIVLKDVKKIYGKGTERVEAIKGVSLEIKEGESLAIMGTSGAGKSTLLNILGCIDKMTTGEYGFYGKDINKCTEDELAKIRNSEIGFVLQDFGLINYKTVFDNVALPFYVGGNKQKKEVVKAKVWTALKKVGIESCINRKIYELSGGQKQRVAIARAIVNMPRVILADEPTGNLDIKNSRLIMELLKEINQEGTSVIVVTHDKEMANYCDRIIIIEDGKILSS